MFLSPYLMQEGRASFKVQKKTRTSSMSQSELFTKPRIVSRSYDSKFNVQCTRILTSNDSYFCLRAKDFSLSCQGQCFHMSLAPNFLGSFLDTFASCMFNSFFSVSMPWTTEHWGHTYR